MKQIQSKEYPTYLPKEALTVAELIEFLSTLNQDQAIVATWEGVDAPILPENVSTSEYYTEPVYLIDVEDYL